MAFSVKLSSEQLSILSRLSTSKKPIKRGALIKKVYGKNDELNFSRFNSDLQMLRKSDHYLASHILCFQSRDKDGNKVTEYSMKKLVMINLR